MEDRNLKEIEKYWSGEMTEQERTAFLQRLEEDERLQEDFGAYTLAKEVIEQDIRNHLKEKMNKWDKPELGSGYSMSTISMLLVLLSAIAVASIIWVCPSEEPVDWKQYAVVDLEGLERSAPPPEDIKSLNQFYLTGQYESARNMIRSMEEDKKLDPAVTFIDALIHYQHGNYAEAVELFALLKENEEAHFSVKEQSAYYYLLCLARMDECDAECQQSLAQIAGDPDHLRQQQAELLVKDLFKE